MFRLRNLSALPVVVGYLVWISNIVTHAQADSQLTAVASNIVVYPKQQGIIEATVYQFDITYTGQDTSVALKHQLGITPTGYGKNLTPIPHSPCKSVAIEKLTQANTLHR